MLTVANFKKVFTKNGGVLGGRIIVKNLNNLSNKQVFANILKDKEIRHFLVNLLEKKIYEGSLYTHRGNIEFGYLNLPVISYTDNDLQMRDYNTEKKG